MSWTSESEIVICLTICKAATASNSHGTVQPESHYALHKQSFTTLLHALDYVGTQLAYQRHMPSSISG